MPQKICLWTDVILYERRLALSAESTDYIAQSSSDGLTSMMSDQERVCLVVASLNHIPLHVSLSLFLLQNSVVRLRPSRLHAANNTHIDLQGQGQKRVAHMKWKSNKTQRWNPMESVMKII